MERMALNSRPFEVQSKESKPSSPEDKAAFMAAELKDAEVIEKLLKRNVDPNIKDSDGRPLLHAILSSDCSCANCTENIESCLAVLLSSACSCDLDINAVDGRGRTAVHVAAKNQLENCVNSLIQHGANMYAGANDGTSALEIIAMKNTDVACRILDRSISIESGDWKNEKCTVKVDFGPVMGSENWSEPQAEMKLLWKLLTERGNTSVAGKIFTHPAVRIFLHQKWTRMRPQISYGFVIYLLWLILYTSYVVYVYVLQCPCRFYTKPKTIIGNLTASTLEVCHLASGLTLALIPLLMLTVILFGWNIIKLMCSPSLYFRMRLNVFEMVILMLVVGTFTPTFLLYTTIPEYHYQVAAFTVFLAWAFTVSELGKFSTVGQYMEMLSHVLERFWTLVPAYIFLIVAFAVSFSILFPTEQPYAVFPFALFKVIVMMAGEIEYQDTFYGDNQNDGAAGGPLVGHLLYALFVIIVAILLMNLLVALTVSDVQSLQKEAEISLASRQIATYHQLECFFYIRRVPHCIRYPYWKMTSVACNIESKHKHCFTFRPNDPYDNSVPEDLKQAALAVAMSWQQRTTECPKKKHYDLKYH